jgi:hypothetical protein
MNQSEMDLVKKAPLRFYKGEMAMMMAENVG